MHNNERCNREQGNQEQSIPLLLVSYGAPECQEDVVPFLTHLFVGKHVPPNRIASATQKYEDYAATTGHYSPLNAECKKLIEGIRRIKPNLPLYWGNLFWHPLLVDTVTEMARDGVKRAVCFATSVFDSPSGNKRYADAMESARQIVGNSVPHLEPPLLEKLPLPFAHPLFIESQTDRLLEALALHALDNLQAKNMQTPTQNAVILFSAHSIPLADAAASHYVEQLQFTCRTVIEKSGTHLPWELVYQSRSGLVEHWLGPDIMERIGKLAEKKHCDSVIVSPIGFFCENMETEYDLDIMVARSCEQLGLKFFRARAVGAMPKICRLIVEWAAEQTNL